MSDRVKKAAKSAKRGAEEKKDRLFAILEFKEAIADAKSGDKSKEVTRDFHYDAEATEALQKHLGPILEYVDIACLQILKEFPDAKLKSPGRNLPPQTFSVSVTTASTIWDLMDNNKRWMREQEEAFKEILEGRFKDCAIKLKKLGEQVKEDIDRYIIFANILQGAPEPKYLDAVNDSLAVFTTEISQQVAAGQDATGRMFAAWMIDCIRGQKNAEKAIIKVRTAKSGVVILNSGLIAGHIAHAAASFGATAPLAIIAIVRSALDIGQIITKAAISIDTMGKAITKEIKLIVDYYATDKKAAVGTEIVLNAVKGVLGVDVPSVSTCNDHIGEYEHKIRTLTSSYNQLQRELVKWKDKIEKYKAYISSAKDMPDKTLQKWQKLIAEAQHSYDKTVIVADGKDTRITDAEKNVKGWRESLSTIEEKTGKWAKYIAKGTAIITSAGLGLGHVGGEAVSGAAEIIEHTHKLLIEMGVVIFEGLSEPLLERFQEVDS